jgi:hypothetical protein
MHKQGGVTKIHRGVVAHWVVVGGRATLIVCLMVLLVYRCTVGPAPAVRASLEIGAWPGKLVFGKTGVYVFGPVLLNVNLVSGTVAKVLAETAVADKLVTDGSFDSDERHLGIVEMAGRDFIDLSLPKVHEFMPSADENEALQLPIVFGNSTKLLATVDSNGHISVYSLKEGKQLLFNLTPPGKVLSLALSEDDRVLVVATKYSADGSAHGTHVYLVNSQTGADYGLAFETPFYSDYLQVNADATTVRLGSRVSLPPWGHAMSGEIWIFNKRNRTWQQVFSTRESPIDPFTTDATLQFIVGIRFTADGPWLQQMKVGDKEPQEYSLLSERMVEDFAVSPDGQFVALLTNQWAKVPHDEPIKNNFLEIWSTSEHTLIECMHVDDNEYSASIQFSKDGARLAAITKYIGRPFHDDYGLPEWIVELKNYFGRYNDRSILRVYNMPKLPFVYSPWSRSACYWPWYNLARLPGRAIDTFPN